MATIIELPAKAPMQPMVSSAPPHATVVHAPPHATVVHAQPQKSCFTPNVLTVVCILFQIMLIVLFGTCTTFHSSLGGQNVPVADGQGTMLPGQYAMFQDTHIMMCIGFGFLYTLLRRYSWSGVSINYLILAFVMQWAVLLNGFWKSVHELHKDPFLDKLPTIRLGISDFVRSDYSAAVVLIAFGAVIGRTTALQMVVLAIFVPIVSCANEYLGYDILFVNDAGGSMYIHTFGASCGLALAAVIGDKAGKAGKHPETSRERGVTAMIGTIFLFAFWPSFNAANLVGGAQTRAALNTLVAISASVIATFSASYAINRKFTDYDIQNATIAGGVAIGACCDMLLNPWGAALTGMVAGGVTTYGFNYVSPWLTSRFGLRDVCGIFNLHLTNGIIGGIASAIAAGSMRTGPDNETFSDPALMQFVGRAEGRTALQQGGFQFAVVLISLVLGAATGVAGGLLISLPGIAPKEGEMTFYEDAGAWNTPPETEEYHEIYAHIDSVVAGKDAAIAKLTARLSALEAANTTHGSGAGGAAAGVGYAAKATAVIAAPSPAPVQTVVAAPSAAAADAAPEPVPAPSADPAPAAALTAVAVSI